MLHRTVNPASVPAGILEHFLSESPATPERLGELDLELMVNTNTALHGTPFTVSVDALYGVTTGISAQDRAVTIRKFVDPQTRPEDFGRPGHIFPLRAMSGGVLRRAGHTEASVDLARLAGLTPNLSGPENFEELRKHYSDRQIIEIVAVISVSGWLNRWNDTIATVTDQVAVDFATEHLRDVGWDIGKHVGAPDEQRKTNPASRLART